MSMFTHAAAAVALTGIIVGAVQGGIALVEDIVSPAPPRALVLIEIGYEDGKIRQLIKPQGADAIVGKWSAKISRGEGNLCAGGGWSNYTGKPYAGTPSKWTGAQCPELQPGDVASATWEWDDADGHRRSTSVEFRIE